MVSAECENPLNRTCSFNGIDLYFHEGYQGENIVNLYIGDDIHYYRYDFNKELCMITLETDPPLYLMMNGMYLDISYTPRFVFQEVFSTDGE